MEHVTDNRKNIHKETQAILLDNYMEMLILEILLETGFQMLKP